MSTRVGFTGGTTRNPTYRTMGDHTETVEITFNPSVISYEQLLDVFWKNHNPHTPSRPQYMSAVFCHGPHQLEAARASMEAVQRASVQPVYTEIKEAEEFYTAEDYHQKYLLRRHPLLLKSLQLSDAEIISSYAAAKLNAFVAGNGTNQHFEEVRHELALSEDQATYIRRQSSRKR